MTELPTSDSDKSIDYPSSDSSTSSQESSTSSYDNEEYQKLQDEVFERLKNARNGHKINGSRYQKLLNWVINQATYEDLRDLTNRIKMEDFLNFFYFTCAGKMKHKYKQQKENRSDQRLHVLNDVISKGLWGNIKISNKKV